MCFSEKGWSIADTYADYKPSFEPVISLSIRRLGEGTYGVGCFYEYAAITIYPGIPTIFPTAPQVPRSADGLFYKHMRLLGRQINIPASHTEHPNHGGWALHSY